MPSGDRDRERYRDRDRDEGYRDDRHREARQRHSSDYKNRRHRSRSHSPGLKRESVSPPLRHYSHRDSRSPSPYSKRSHRRASRSPEPWGSHQHDLDHDRSHPRPPSPPPKKKAKPNYGLSGLLAAATNTKNGVVLKYNEPPEGAGKKCKGWRVFVFKEGKEVDSFSLDKASSFLVGRDRAVADIPVDHTSCSKQHAVVQFRQVSAKNKNGESIKEIKPYLIDLESTNGTMLNGERIEERRYYEIRSEDMVKFGESTREYVFIKDPSVQ